MSSGYFYSLAEGFRGLRRAKFSTFVSISTIFLSLVLIGIFIIFIFNVQRLIQQIQSRVELEVFIDNSYTIEQIDELRQEIFRIKGVESVLYISKEDAAEIFKNQFGQDVFQILNENPLPASFQIKLSQQHRSAEKAQQIFNQINRLNGVDEVLYRHDLTLMLERYIRLFIIVIFTMGVLLGIGSIFLVSNTIKLIIFSRRTIIEIMKLVGATQRFIRRPFIVEGVVQGTIGGILAALFFYLVFRFINVEIPGLILIDESSYPILIVVGLLWGYIGSKIALRKFLKY
ncbi:MAG: cell division protein FtsX [Candidatus Zhuqueibacterota bacterium]